MISIDPNIPAAYYNRGLARTEKQEVEVAMAEFAKGVGVAAERVVVSAPAVRHLAVATDLSLPVGRAE